MNKIKTRRSTFAILGSGTINFKTGDTKYFNIFENFGNLEGALFLLRRYDYQTGGTLKPKYKVVCGSGNYTQYSNFQVEDNPQMHYDQTPNRLYECDWKVIAAGDISKETLKMFKEEAQKNSVGFAVFK